MILIDSSAWVHFFNQTHLSASRLVAELLRLDQVATCGLVVTEILSGAKQAADLPLLQRHFDLLPFLEPVREDYDEAGRMRARLRRRGIRVKTVDTLIARLAIREKIPLLHFDGDFNRIARHFLLKVYEGSLR